MRPAKITLDTSALLAVPCGEESRGRIIEAIRGATLMAPASLPWELGNALSAMLRRRRLSLEQAHSVLAVYRSIPLTLVTVELAAALELAQRHGLYAYDAYMLACARDHDAPLLTLDGALQRAASAATIPLMEVGAP